MLSFHAHLKVFVATAPCDLRANFNGLWAAAQERLGEDPRSGACHRANENQPGMGGSKPATLR
jgi:hypothetical protein